MSKPPGNAAMERRDFLRAGALAALATAVDVSLGESRAGTASPSNTQRLPFQHTAFELEETTIAALQEGMASGRYSAHSIAS